MVLLKLQVPEGLVGGYYAAKRISGLAFGVTVLGYPQWILRFLFLRAADHVFERYKYYGCSRRNRGYCKVEAKGKPKGS